MTPHVIVSYDDSQNDHDALRLGGVLHALGATLTLAYVRHATLAAADREALAQLQAEALLERGSTLLDDSSIARRVVVSPSTSDGLRAIAAAEEADVIVFGPEYRTAPGHVAVGRTAQRLLDNGPAAIALAPAGYAGGELSRIGILPGTADEAAIETAYSLAGRYDATVTDTTRGIDLLIVGSRREAPEGRVMVSSSAAVAIEEATVPVLVPARGAPLHFDTLVTV